MAVVIETTLGDITVDLFLEQRPRTCLNFLKLCKMKYYNYNLFHSIQSGFLAQTGDPTGTGKGGESIWGILEGRKKRYFAAERVPRIRHADVGTLSMVCAEDSMVGSQFFFTLGPDLDSLDATHCVIGIVTEGHDVLRLLNEVICDESHRPFRDIRITHTVVLEDPFNDPERLRVPSRSPSPSAERLMNGRIAPDEEIDETKGKTLEEINEMIEEKEAKARATILEIVGDLPDADVAPPENVLFVCKLNPVTTDSDLEIIFSRFGKIVNCEIIRDKKSGDSLQYAFIEFENQKYCENAYFKMDNVLIDDRRIHVDFSQSVSRIKYLGKGRGVRHLKDREVPTDDKEEDKLKHNKDETIEKDKRREQERPGGDRNRERHDPRRSAERDRRRRSRSRDRGHRDTRRRSHDRDRHRRHERTRRDSDRRSPDRRRHQEIDDRQRAREERHRRHRRSSSRSPVRDRYSDARRTAQTSREIVADPVPQTGRSEASTSCHGEPDRGTSSARPTEDRGDSTNVLRRGSESAPDNVYREECENTSKNSQNEISIKPRSFEDFGVAEYEEERRKIQREIETIDKEANVNEGASSFKGSSSISESNRKYQYEESEQHYSEKIVDSKDIPKSEDKRKRKISPDSKSRKHKINEMKQTDSEFNIAEASGKCEEQIHKSTHERRDVKKKQKIEKTGDGSVTNKSKGIKKSQTQAGEQLTKKKSHSKKNNKTAKLAAELKKLKKKIKKRKDSTSSSSSDSSSSSESSSSDSDHKKKIISKKKKRKYSTSSSSSSSSSDSDSSSDTSSSSNSEDVKRKKKVVSKKTTSVKTVKSNNKKKS